MQNIKIISMGKYLPTRVVTAEELDERLGLEKGWTAAKSGVLSRHYYSGETSSQMGAIAAKKALDKANMTLKEIDCIIGASAMPQQGIPCTASLVQKELGGEDSGIPCFDVNSTCYSFVTALDLISHAIESGKYKNVLIVSAEIASVGLNWDDPKSCTLFGDGAIAAIITKTPASETSKIVSANMETYSAGSECATVKGSGTMLHSREYREDNKTDFLFNMSGEKIYKLASKYLPKIVEKTLNGAGLKISDLALTVPHQASVMAMKLVQRKLNIDDEKFMYIIQNHGNTIAASIPMALYEAIEQNKVKRGDKIMLLGTSAGLSIGVMVLEY